MSTLSDIERDRLLEAGRRLLNEKRKKSLQSSGANASVPSVTQALPTPSAYSLPSSPSTPSAPFFSASSENFTFPRSNIPTFTEKRNDSSPGGFMRTVSDVSPRDASPRDVNLQKRVSELTLERSEMQAKLFKQEKANEEIISQNNLLRQRVAAFEKSIGNSQLLQDRIDLLESQNKKLEEENAKLQQDRKQEQMEWESLKNNMDENSYAFESLRNEKNEIEAKLKFNLQTFEETLEERNQREQQMETTIQQQNKKIEELRNVQQELNKKLSEAEAEKTSTSEALVEKEQQLSILYKESEQRQRDNQDYRTFLNQKNELIQQLQGKLAGMESEKQNHEKQIATQKDEIQKLQFSLQQLQNLLKEKQQELLRSEDNYQRLYNEKSEQKAGAMQEQIGKGVNTMNQLQETIEQLTEDKEKLKLTIEQYQELLDNMQSTTNQISLSYDHTITQMKNKYEEDIRKLLQNNNELQGHIRMLQSRAGKSTNSQSNSPDQARELQEYVEDLKKLEFIRAEHRKYKPPTSISLEEVQEQKIHQLLEEISLMENLMKKIGVVEKLQAVLPPTTDSSTYEKLKECEHILEFTRREKQALLDAIETGDLSPYIELQQLQQNSVSNFAESPPSPRTVDLNGKKPENPVLKEFEEEPEIVVEPVVPKENSTKPKEKSKKRGWFW